MESLRPKLDRMLQGPRKLSGRKLSIENPSSLVFSSDNRSTLVDPLLDSSLLYNTYNVARAMESLSSPDITGTTKRELLDRTLRAVGKQTLIGQIPYDVYASAEDTARTFYGEHHLIGEHKPIVFDEKVRLAASQARIERSNRGLAASYWEQKILDTTVQEADEFYDKYADHQPVVVSVAFGGNEPALLLSNILNNCPIVKLRIDKDEKTHSYLGADEISAHDSIFFVVDDTRNSGSTMGYAERAVQADFSPGIMRSVIVQDYSKTHR